MDELHSQIIVKDEESGEDVSLFVIEETELSKEKYLLVAESENEDADAMILHETHVDEASGDVFYEPVTDDTLLQSLGKIFSELLSGTEVELKIE
ncbi:MAG: DUF1292 domain-containing protein [Lachnospiraceae bacterium]|jgi:hypothetical protein|nr:DUF1292 domain-containing protein [Lachnospiraceae bacterium]MBQ6259255.1 DUF1292 domain-containing protein [Lachnospiraceae bacterium]